jgi:PAS domain S-box-containing protein
MEKVRSFGLNRTLGAAIAAIAMTVLLSSGGVLLTLGQIRDAVEAQDRARRIIRSLDGFLDAMLNQETGLRGYLLTGRDSSLAPYEEGKPAFETSVGTLQAELAHADLQEQALLGEAIEAARAWQHDIGDPILRAMADPATRPNAASVEETGQGKQRFDTFRARLKAIEEVERQHAVAARDAMAAATHNAALAGWIGALIILAICAGVAVMVARIIVRPLTRLADVMTRLVRRDLSAEVPGIEMRNEVGAMARAVAVFKNSLVELDRSSLLRTTADTLPAMVGYIDVQGRIGFLNGEFARWFDFGAADVASAHGRKLTEIFGSGRFPGAEGELLTALGGEEVRFEHRLVKHGAGYRAVEAYYRPHRSAGGEVLGVVTLLTDISERKVMELRMAQQTRELRRSNEELEQFAYVASHDLKAPLRGIDNLVTWIEEDLAGQLTGDVATNMNLLKSRVRRLESLLDDLLAYSRAGRGEIVYDTVDTRALVEELAVLINPPDGFRITGSDRLPTIRTARAALTQALQNLIGNAIKHHDQPADGHVEIDARPASGSGGELTEFSVTDDGPGIPAQFRERVFGMFQTLRPRDEIEGSGMGLAIVKKLVERQGGKIWLEDAPGGRGLSVHFTWPNNERDVENGADRESAAD